MFEGMEMMEMGVKLEGSMGMDMGLCRMGRRGMVRMVSFRGLCLLGFSIIFVKISIAHVQ